MHVICDSERVLSLFRGVMNVIEPDDAETATADDVVWLLYVRGNFDAGISPEQLIDVDNPAIRFGTRSEKAGFRGMNLDYDLERRELSPPTVPAPVY